jgi:hypothetical protein
VTDENPDGLVCIFIPTVVNREWKFGPPDPPEHVDFHDLTILRNIHELASGLSRNQGVDIMQSVNAMFESTTRRLGLNVAPQEGVALEAS